MTAEVDLWVIAGLQLLAAVGIAAFWVVWLRSDHDAEWLPEGYVEHERPFVWADGVLAAVLVASAALLLAGHPLGRSLALIASGMLAFLGVLDLAYFTRHRMFARRRGGVGNAVVVGGVLALSLLLAVRFA